jgi:uncharacterized alkaline shock family protein YloU
MYLSIVLYILISLAVGVGLIGLSLDNQWLNLKTYVDYIASVSSQNLFTRSTVFLSGALIVLIFLRMLQKAFSRAKSKKTIRAKTDQGQIDVTLVAIEDMVKKVLHTSDNIAHIRSKVTSNKKDVIINVKLTLKKAVNVKSFAQEIQEKIKNKIQTILGDQRNLKINLEIRKISAPPGDTEPDAESNDEQGLLRTY